MKEVKRKVLLSGIRPIMFDRYAGDNDTSLTPEQKMYYRPGTTVIVIPSQNILSMLGSNLYKCATKIKYGKQHGSRTDAVQGFLDIEPILVPFSRKGKEIEFGEFGKDGFYVDESVARIKKSAGVYVPNPKKRPVLDMPWELEFTLTIFPNDQITEETAKELFSLGLLNIGIGTWRGRYGKAVIQEWK